MQLEDSRQIGIGPASKEKSNPHWWRGLFSPALAVLAFFLGLYFLTGTYFTKGVSDGEVMAQTAVALAQKHTVELPVNPGLPQIVAGKDGHFFSKYGLGQPLVAAGLYKTGQIFSRYTMPQADANVIGHFFIMLLPVLATAFTVWLVYLWGQELYHSVKIGLGVAVLYGLGTMAWPYSRVFFSEPLFTLTTFGAAYGLWRAKRSFSDRSRFSWLALAGFLFGYSLVTKIAGLVLFPAYLLYLLSICGFSVSTIGALARPFSLKKATAKLNPQTDTHHPPSTNHHSPFLSPLSSFLFPLSSFLLGLLPAVGLILLHNYLRFGSPFNNGYDGESFDTPFWKGFSGLLFSPGKSLFLYSPVLLALPFAVKGFWQRAKAESVLIGLVAAITLLYYSVWWAWEGGWCWGPRFLVPLLPFLILPLGILLEKGRIWVILLFGVLFPVSLLVQMLGVALDFNVYLATQGNGPDAYAWNPAASPIVNHWSRLWDASQNQIRGLTLDQLGFKRSLGRLISALVAGLTLLGGSLVCLNYLWAKRKLNEPKP